MMTINELGNIFNSNGVYKFDYSLSEDDPPLAETVLCLRKIGENKYKFYVSDRGEIIDEVLFDFEDKACQYLLNEMACDYKQLKKYVK